MYIYNMNYNLKKEEILEQYYQAWKLGLKSDEILKRINFNNPDNQISIHKFNELQAHFFNYTRDRMKQENISRTFTIEKTPELEAQFIEYVKHGVPYDKAAKIMNIPMSTLLDVWFNDTNFKIEVEYALEKANVEVVKALHKKAVGYDKILTTRTKTVVNGQMQKGLDNGMPGGQMTTESETIREEHVQPSVEAAKFWLINKSHESWSPDGGLNKEGNKGKILESIDKMCELSEEDKEELDEIKS